MSNRDRTNFMCSVELPFDSTNKNRALPVNRDDLASETLVPNSFAFDRNDNLVISKDMYQDDVIAAFHASWQSRPGVHQNGHVDQNIEVVMRALLFTFEHAAWEKHGYSQSSSEGQVELENMKGALSYAPSVEQVAEVYGRVLEGLKRRV